jgi:ADP-ribose pyrophosphatase YjhB (NUDIX family)
MAPFQVNFCPACGTKTTFEFKFGAERAVCPSCGWIHFKDPKVAAAVLVEHNGNILLVQRANEPYRGLWTLPAGFVNGGEDPAKAAERECWEETGLTVRVIRVLDVVAGKEHERGADFVIAFQAEIIQGKLTAGDDAADAKWFPRNEMPALAFRATKKILLL